jgi:ribA/ribD-fused uncharacterized protein
VTSVIKTGVVKEFRGEYAFLSNYCLTPFEWRGIEFPTSEHAFAYAKTFFCTDEDEARRAQASILKTGDAGVAKRIGRQVRINVSQWDDHKVQYMREIVHAKFMTGENLVGPLVNTGAMMLVEGNDWGDKFWGRCLDKSTGRMVGLNTLGAILMEERGSWLRTIEKCGHCENSVV